MVVDLSFAFEESMQSRTHIVRLVSIFVAWMSQPLISWYYVMLCCCLSPGHLVITGVWIQRKLRNTKNDCPWRRSYSVQDIKMYPQLVKPCTDRKSSRALILDKVKLKKRLSKFECTFEVIRKKYNSWWSNNKLLVVMVHTYDPWW